MDLEIKDRFEERRDGIVCAAIVWENDTVSTRTSVRVPREIDLGLVGVDPEPLAGLLAPSATAGRLLDGARRTAALTVRRGQSDGRRLPPAAGRTIEWLRAASELVEDTAYTWGPHNAPQRWADDIEVIVTSGGAVLLGKGKTHAGARLAGLHAGRIVGYRQEDERQSLHPITQHPGGVVAEDGNAVIVRKRASRRHPVVDTGFDDAWHEHAANWFEGAVAAGRIERRRSMVVYVES